MKELSTGIMIGLATIAAILSGAPIAETVTPLSTVGIWETLNLMSNVVAPVVGALNTVMIWFHRLVNEIENSQNELDSSLFGSERDALNEGVIIEVRKMRKEVQELQESIDEIKERSDRLEREIDDD